MKKITYILLLLLFVTAAKGQNGLAGYEYWFDADYENRQQVSSSATEIEIEADASGLRGGIHSFRFRALRDDGMPGIIHSYTFLKPILDNRNVEELKCEYWVDDDYANRKMADGNAEGLISFEADIAAIPPGLHQLNYHIANAEGESAITYSHRFLRVSADNNLYTAFACEYWLDDDFENRKRVENVDGIISFDAEVSQLCAGIHRLNFRAVDEYGHYGALHSHNFLRAILDNSMLDEMQCEYWWDDNFAGRATVAVASDGLVNLEADASALPIGVHLFNYRLKDANGCYTPVRTQHFMVPRYGAEASDVDKYAYWFDSLPADTVEVTPANPYEIENMMFDIPATPFPTTWPQTASVTPATVTGDGKVMVTLGVEQERMFYMTFHNENDLWSSVDSTAFIYVNESVVEAQPLTVNRVYHIHGLKADSADVRYIDAEAGTLCLRTEQPCALRLYNDSVCIAKLDAATLQAGTTIQLPKAGRYYALLHVADEAAESVSASIKLICVTDPLPNPLHVAEAGTAGDLLSFTPAESIEQLAVTGELNATDLETLRTLSSLRTLELQEAKITNNTLPEKAFYGMAALEEISLPTTVTTIGKEVLAGMGDHLLVVRWNSQATLAAEVFDAAAEMGNCLIYAPAGVRSNYSGNVVIGGMAEQITLQDELPLRAPEAFKAKQISYTRDFSLPTTPKQPGGWESIVLPFSVQNIVSEERGELAPFGSNKAGTRPFWLAELTATGFANVTQWQANKPYIISMPNSEAYEEEFNIRGNVTFSAAAEEGVEVAATTAAKASSGTSFNLHPAYEAVAQGEAIYALNKEAYGEHVAGSAFISNLRTVNPFEAYVTSNEATTRAPMYYGIGIPSGGEVTGIETLLKDEALRVWCTNGVLYIRCAEAQTLPLYNSDGRMVRLLQLTEGENQVTGLTSGFYLVGKKKVVVI
ncbi:MAG: hypothetical protein J6C87_07685 [Bacteroides sp.]|nr:hypothetical protein [Bacteroides sp.]